MNFGRSAPTSLILSLIKKNTPYFEVGAGRTENRKKSRHTHSPPKFKKGGCIDKDKLHRQTQDGQDNERQTSHRQGGARERALQRKVEGNARGKGSQRNSQKPLSCKPTSEGLAATVLEGFTSPRVRQDRETERRRQAWFQCQPYR